MIRVVSLTRTPERRHLFTALNRHVPHQFFDAVDGQTLTWETLSDLDLFAPGLSYTLGAVGCALSHRALWLEAVEAGKPVTVVEDDAVLRLDFERLQARLLSQAAIDWDIVVWGWNSDSPLSIADLEGIAPMMVVTNQDDMRRNVMAFRSLTTSPAIHRLAHCFGTPCYTVSPKGAAELLRRCFPLRPFDLAIPGFPNTLPNTGIDLAMNAHYRALQAFVALPPLAMTPNQHETSTTLAQVA